MIRKCQAQTNATYKVDLRDILGIILVAFISPMKHDLINLVSWLGYTKQRRKKNQLVPPGLIIRHTPSTGAPAV